MVEVRLIDIREVARRLGVSVKTVRNRAAVAKGFPAAVAPLGSRRLLWRSAAIDEYIETLKPR